MQEDRPKSLQHFITTVKTLQAFFSRFVKKVVRFTLFRLNREKANLKMRFKLKPRGFLPNFACVF